MNYPGGTFKRSGIRALAVILLTLSSIVAMALAPRIPRDEAYHHFADQRSVFGISYFLNVVSNLPLSFAGVAGLLLLTRNDSTASSGRFINRFERWPYIVFFFGATLTCFGSAYYHLAPTTDRLGAAGLYVLAKVVEILDSQVFAIGRIVSGHTLKHLVAAAAVYWIFHMLTHRTPAPDALPAIQASCG